MKTVKVVTSSSMFGDTTESISYLTSGDKRELEQQDRDLGRRIDRLKEFMDNQNSSCMEAINELQSGVRNVAMDVNGKISNTTRQINDLKKTFQKKEKEFSDTFVNQCSADVMKYFEALAEHAKKIESELSIIQKEKEIIEEQLKVSSAIASFFLEFYKKELNRNSDDLPRMKQLIENMTSALVSKNDKKSKKA